jgi:DNA (cytosine-5)-methyltransferase 1
MSKLTGISLYSGGCDGVELAASWCGIETVAFCECDKACRALLAARHPNKPIFTYDTEVTKDALEQNGIRTDSIDMVYGGPPCQAASVAGKRLGACDARNRWPEYLRIVDFIRPRWAIAENVPGLLSVDNGELFRDILRQMAEMGYRVGWCVYGACDVGAPHKRERLFIVAYSDSR